MKNIFLCADGTGNAGGKANGTNVWRIYQAIDLSRGDQVAFHDDGVGTQDNKIWRAIGGATGAGLGRNIRDLYKSLVRVYREGDQIFLFGFSRGAFTARSLAGLITRFSILDRHSFSTPRDLDEAVSTLYGYYDARAKKRETFEAWAKEHDINYFEGHVEVIGVWDTVDAVGVPFSELREWLRDCRILTKHNHELNPRIKNAYHALSIDDQRKTFTPTLFDESKMSKDGSQQVEQVWFAGVHSNVGGSYAKDEASYLPLSWMMARVAAAPLKKPLHFIDGRAREYAVSGNAFGMLYDSRAGLAAYYRYRPRDIGQLCADKCAGGVVKIHESVFERIEHQTGAYAPANIPPVFAVTRWDPIPGNTAEGPTEPRAARSAICRVNLPKQANDLRGKMSAIASRIANWRTWLYSIFVLVSLVFAGIAGILGYFYEGSDFIFDIAFPPELAEFAAALFADWRWLLLFAGLFGVLVLSRGFLVGAARGLASLGWRYLSVKSGEAIRDLDASQEKMSVLQEKERASLKKEIDGLVDRIGPVLRWQWTRTGGMAKLFMVASILVVAFAGHRISTENSRDETRACTALAEHKLGDGNTFYFEARNPCLRTGIPVKAGQEITVTVEPTVLYDLSIPALPTGFLRKADGEGAFMERLSTFNRAPNAPYFTLLGQVVSFDKPEEDAKLLGKSAPFKAVPVPGADHNATTSVASTTFTLTIPNEGFTAGGRGELVLFLNDLDVPWFPPGRFAFYDNNTGTAWVTIK
ncbi:MAG: DUF2235 domain-containing protein [Proteobacteria bacterium]|nr:DUF2235 domain-containing protein [Pseudomonadota bacterium]